MTAQRDARDALILCTRLQQAMRHALVAELALTRRGKVALASAVGQLVRDLPPECVAEADLLRVVLTMLET